MSERVRIPKTRTNVQKKRQRNPLKGSRVFGCNPSPTTKHEQKISTKFSQTLSQPPHRLLTSIHTPFSQNLHFLSSPQTLHKQSNQSLCQNQTYTHYFWPYRTEPHQPNMLSILTASYHHTVVADNRFIVICCQLAYGKYQECD